MYIMNNKIVYLLLISMLMIIGCKTKDTIPKVEKNPNANTENMDFVKTVLVKNLWTLTHLNGSAYHTEVTLAFAFEEGSENVLQVGGRGFCNNYFTSMKINADGTITFSLIGSTRKMCTPAEDGTEPDLLDYEYFEMLEKSMRIDVQNNILHLISADDTILAIFYNGKYE